MSVNSTLFRGREESKALPAVPFSRQTLPRAVLQTEGESFGVKGDTACSRRVTGWCVTRRHQ